MARRCRPTRRLIILGQAGDRDDNAIREFARSAWGFRPDRIVLKEMENYLRGRAPGRSLGNPARRVPPAGRGARKPSTRADSEFEAVRAASGLGTAGRPV